MSRRIKDDEGVKESFRSIQMLRQGFEMVLIAQDRVGEAADTVILAGLPFTGLGISRNVTALMLHLDHKDAIPGEHDMVELRGAIAVQSRDVEFVQSGVVI